MASSSADKLLGFSLMALASAIFVYYTLWVIVTPFVHTDAWIQRFFPDRLYALLVPIVAGVMVLALVGCFVIYVTVKKHPSVIVPATTMRLTVMYRDKLFNMEVLEEMEIMNFKAFCSVEASLQDSSGDIRLLCNGVILEDGSKTLKDYNVQDNDVIMMETPGRGPPPSQGSRSRANPAGLMNIDFGSIAIPGSQPSSSQQQQLQQRIQQLQQQQQQQQQQRNSPSSSGYPDDPRVIYDMLKKSPHERAIIREGNPPLSAAIEANDFEKFKQVLTQQRKERAEKEVERIRLLTADPFDADVQKKIAEEIRLKNVDSNMETAMEYAPESFGQVVMLYIDCVVNGHHVKAFVDSGAQMTIMSQACAERCGIMRLVDVRWAGLAKGVGVQKIIGRVHLGQIQIGSDYLQSSFSILEEQPMDMLLGLDMLKRHQCVIDLKNGELMIGTTGTKTTFLPESELPEHARLNRPPSVSDDQLMADVLNKSAKEAAGAATSSGALDPEFERKVRTITESGFAREQAITELRRSNGNVDQALAVLIANSFSNVKR